LSAIFSTNDGAPFSRRLLLVRAARGTLHGVIFKLRLGPTVPGRLIAAVRPFRRQLARFLLLRASSRSVLNSLMVSSRS
jgi:hypothetical protein